MIDYLNGTLTEIQPAVAVIECGGVGYEVNITLIDYPNLSYNTGTKLYIHESIREDAHVLFGFLTKRARELFRLLIAVSGVGPNTARLILSALSSEQVESAISSGNEVILKSVKGIGGKTAQRIIVDLKDKIKASDNTLLNSQPIVSETYEDALAALIMLGFNATQCKKALSKIFASGKAVTTEEAVKQAIKMF